jgi:hypothetical protein
VTEPLALAVRCEGLVLTKRLSLCLPPADIKLSFERLSTRGDWSRRVELLQFSDDAEASPCV